MPAGPLSPQGRQKVLTILLAALLLFCAVSIVRVYRVFRDISGFTTYDRVRAVLVRRMSVEKDKVTPAATLRDLADDLDRREFVHALNEEFGLDLSEDETQTIATVQDAVNLVDRHFAARRR